VAAGACGGASHVGVDDLAGRTFVAERARGQVVVLEFLDGDTVHIDLGCDHVHDEPWGVDDEGRLSLPAPFTTGADCARSEQIGDQAVLTILASLPRLALDDGTLTVTADDDLGQLVLHEGEPGAATGE
jgi:hypothetical protein